MNIKNLVEKQMKATRKELFDLSQEQINALGDFSGETVIGVISRYRAIDCLICEDGQLNVPLAYELDDDRYAITEHEPFDLYWDGSEFVTLSESLERASNESSCCNTDLENDRCKDCKEGAESNLSYRLPENVAISIGCDENGIDILKKLNIIK